MANDDQTRSRGDKQIRRHAKNNLSLSSGLLVSLSFAIAQPSTLRPDESPSRSTPSTPMRSIRSRNRLHIGWEGTFQYRPVEIRPPALPARITGRLVCV